MSATRRPHWALSCPREELFCHVTSFVLELVPQHNFSLDMVSWIRVCSSIALFLLSLSSFPSTGTAEPYKYLSYGQIYWRLTELAAKYPKLLRLYSAQQTFLLPHVGNCTQLESATDEVGTNAPCTIWVVELSNLETLPSEPERPEMMVSGTLHGNEVIGPHAVLAFLEHMVSNYESDPHIKRMVDTRLVVATPMTNAIGFSLERRSEIHSMENGTETSVDPNRDFGFDQDPTKCMRTVAARTLNELFRTHLFRVLITFHGGTNVIGYEWGDTQHCTGPMCKPAPDTAIMRALGERMSNVAGPAGRYEAAYPVGDMGRLVYPVKGGLEDWAYGASWSGQGVECRPDTLGGYPKEKVKLDRRTQRCVTYLVETAREKKPSEHMLGSSEAILQRGSDGDGHVPRNVRLLLSTVDALEPYILLDAKASTNEHNKPIVSWMVGGAFAVDACAVQWRTESGEQHDISDVQNGTMLSSSPVQYSLKFSHALMGPFPSKSTHVFVRVAAVLDHQYALQPNDSDPNVTPQGHLMGSRASPQWSFSTADHKIEGRQVFFSKTMRLEMSGSHTFAMTDADDVEWSGENAGAYSMSDDELFKHLYTGEGPAVLDANGGLSVPLTILTAALGILVIIAMAVGIFIFAGEVVAASALRVQPLGY
ncbi:unnamed protein product [Chondrus crispus]|uniref:Peptidase M14 domain-containing protein n=1 Tax=Chondrus crispus TaxID=2769 RepID=R7QLV3_CHOCR|nr:unnamed protein product [Chondrus crispus]CDF38763.1 unnamed protein product [Chondrus crispus]|eukprot:XP_005718668.1 unnamed protein product [Chondrus crispus]